MDEWPQEKKDRVCDLIRQLNLPATGKALDFGCGNGVFTDVIKTALPKWKVCGSDLSSVAIENAAKRFPQCEFFYGDSHELSSMQFDFIFSHHVLEHVEDQHTTAKILKGLAATGAIMLHIMPCGNKGSLEYNLCQLVKNGIRPNKGHTFFFEEEMHLQRFTTDSLAELFRPYNFEFVEGYYANQYYGALQWIAGMSKQFVQKITDKANAINSKARFQLTYYRLFFLLLYYLHRPYYCYKQSMQQNNLSLLKKGLFYSSMSAKYLLDNAAKREWKNRRQQPNGSEMYLLFKKD